MRWWILLLVSACAPPTEPAVCATVCDELVHGCGYAAFPSFESCLQGCTWWEEEGVDVRGYLTCVEAASCETFAIVECEHGHGLDAPSP